MNLTFTKTLFLLTFFTFNLNFLLAQTCSADITLSTQTDVDDFQSNYGCTAIEGKLIIQTNGTPSIVNLNGLAGLEYVAGDLQITVNTTLTEISALSSLEAVGGNLIVGFNPALSNVDGFSNLKSIGNNLTLALNQSLLNVDGFSSLQEVPGQLMITVNTGLTNIDGFNGLQNVGQSLDVTQNMALENVSGLINVTKIGQSLNVANNLQLNSIEGLANINSLGSSLTIIENPLLVECCYIYDLINTPGSIGGYIEINSNQTGCDSPVEILTCNVLIDADEDGYDESIDCDDNEASCYPGAEEVCDGLDNNCDGNIDEGLDCYCESYGESTETEWIKKVKLEEINNKTYSDEGYGDYTSVSTHLVANETYKIKLNPRKCNKQTKKYWGVWIDWNQDDIFDPSEQIVKKKSHKKIKRNFEVPVDALIGNTRMRVAMSLDGHPEPCSSFHEGEVEDYTIEVLPPIHGMGQGNVFTFATSKNNMRTDLDWHVSEDVDMDYYQVESSKDGINFKVIETVSSRRDDRASQYKSADTNPSTGINFYRIKMVNQSGEAYYSEVRKENYDVDINDLIVYPNPTDGILHLSMKDFAGQSANVEIYNNSGQRLSNRAIDEVPAGSISFDVTTYKTGTYYLSVKVGNLRKISKRFVVIKK